MQHGAVDGGGGDVDSVVAVGGVVHSAVVPELRLSKVPIDCCRYRWNTGGRIGDPAFMRVGWDVASSRAQGEFDSRKICRKIPLDKPLLPRITVVF